MFIIYLPQSLLYHHYSFRNHTTLICFFFTPPNFKRLTNLSSPSTLTYCFVLHCTQGTAFLLLIYSIIPTPSSTITCYSKKYCQCSQFAVTTSVTSLFSLSWVGFLPLRCTQGREPANYNKQICSEPPM